MHVIFFLCVFSASHPNAIQLRLCPMQPHSKFCSLYAVFNPLFIITKILKMKVKSELFDMWKKCIWSRIWSLHYESWLLKWIVSLLDPRLQLLHLKADKDITKILINYRMKSQIVTLKLKSFTSSWHFPISNCCSALWFCSTSIWVNTSSRSFVISRSWLCNFYK